ncbi:MBL fold metallo-hydrolase [Halobacteriales archaeon Cl-PHB]
MTDVQDLCGVPPHREISMGDGEAIHWFEETIELDPLRDWLTNHPEGQAYGDDWYEPGRDLRINDNAFLFRGTEETLLYDTLSPASTDRMVEELTDALGGETLDYLVVSHDEAPHAGNTFAILNEYPDAELLGSDRGSPAAELHHLEDATRVEYGHTIDLGGYVVDFIEPIFMDSPATAWIFERSTGWMCTVDSFGYPHYRSDSLKFEDEMETDLTEQQMSQYNGRSLQWLKYTDPEKVRDQITHHLETYDVGVVAPSHGHPIREDVDKCIDICYESANRLSEEGTFTPLFQVATQMDDLEESAGTAGGD